MISKIQYNARYVIKFN